MELEQFRQKLIAGIDSVLNGIKGRFLDDDTRLVLRAQREQYITDDACVSNLLSIVKRLKGH